MMMTVTSDIACLYSNTRWPEVTDIVLRRQTTFSKCLTLVNTGSDVKIKRYSEILWQLQQRVVIHFCVKLGYNFTQIKTSLTACYPRVLCDASIYFWIKAFQGGRTRIVDTPRAKKSRSGCSRANIHHIENIVTQDRRATVRQMSTETGIKYTSVQKILKFDLKLVKKCAKFVPYDLTDRHKCLRMDICDFWNRLLLTTPRVFNQIVTMDESWVYVYDPQLKDQSLTWLRKGEARPQKPKRGIATAKVMIVTFFDSKGLIYFEYVQRPNTVNQIYFRQILTRFTAAYHRRRPRSSVGGRHFIHMDNAPAHNATLTLALTRQLGWRRVPQPPCSPDLAPNDFFLYPRLKKDLRGQKFANVEALKDAVADQIAAIPSADYKHCLLQSWPRRWRKCLAYQGNYFEGMP